MKGFTSSVSGENSGKLTGDEEREARSSSLSSGILGISGYSMSWGFASSFTGAKVGMLLVLEERKWDVCWNDNDVADTEIKWSPHGTNGNKYYNNTVIIQYNNTEVKYWGRGQHKVRCIS